MPSTIASLLTGATFGTGLTLSGVASPQVIKDQFRLSDFHMLATFLTASATSAAIFAVYNLRYRENKIPAKPASSHGWIGKYDGNIIGGSMIGLGMSMTGACPGTVLVQATAGIGNSRLLACTSLIAGIVWIKLKTLITRKSTSTSDDCRITSATGRSSNIIIIGYETVVLTILIITLAFAPRSVTLLHPVIGGLLVGVGQLSSVLLAGAPVGVSGAYEEFGRLFWDALSGKAIISASHSIKFACGMIMGSWLTMLNVPAIREVLNNSEEPSLPFTVIGGFLLTFGARIAGGCTSGHGISGMSSLGLSSFITVGSMFGTGMIAGSLFP